MQGLYEAIGRIASAAHANGDKIDENILPEDAENNSHGIDVIHNGRLVLLRDVAQEPRFSATCPFSFSTKLRNQYNPQLLAERSDVDFTSLPEAKQQQVIESILIEDLEAITKHEEDFRRAIQSETNLEQVDVIRLSYDEGSLWNGFAIQVRLFPYRESFDIKAYRDVMNTVVQSHNKVLDLVYREVPSLLGENPEKEQSFEDGLIHNAGFE